MRFALKTLALGAVAALVAASASAQTTNTYNSSAPVPIIDLGTAISPIVVPAGDWGSSTIRDVNVSINISHTWDSDINVSLTAPDGVVVQLWSGVGGSADNFNVTIDDEATTNINGTVGTFRPQSYPTEAMCENDDHEPGGTWQLTVSDTVGGDAGMINSWSITIEGDDGRFTADCGASTTTRTRRGLGSHANNGGGNGDDLPPPGQRGR